LAEKCAEASVLFIAIRNGNRSAAERLVSLVENHDNPQEEEEEEEAVLTRMAAAGYLILLLHGEGSGSVLFKEDDVLQCRALAAQYVPMYLEYDEKLQAVNHAYKKYVAYILGGCYEEGWGVEKDGAKCYDYYKRAAEGSYCLGEVSLGRCYGTGTGVTQSSFEAVKWFQKGAEQGYASAQNNLGLSYAHGQGVTQSDEEAVKWFEKAANQGNADAQYTV
jgi:TPR repeat protein